MVSRLVDWFSRNFVAVFTLAFVAVAAFLLAMIVLKFWILPPTFDWGLAGVLDAVRLSQGMPVYEQWPAGHPTWLYGPGFIWMFAAIFKVLPPTQGVLSGVSLLASLVTVALCGLILRARLPGAWLVIALLSFFLIDGQLAIFGATSTDAYALLFALGGLCLCFRATLASVLAGGVLIVIAALTKQPMLSAAAVPALALVLEGRRPPARQVGLAMIPLALIALTFAIAKTHPVFWFYYVEVSAQYSDMINYRDFVFHAANHLIYAAPVWICTIVILWQGIVTDPGWQRLLRWTLAATLVATAFGALAQAKFGGAANSLMPAWFALVLLCWVLMEPVVKAAFAYERGWVLQAGLLLTLFLWLVPKDTVITAPIDYLRKGDHRSYAALRTYLRSLPGEVMSPGDVMVTFRDRGQFDRSVWLDADILKWPHNLPDWLIAQSYTAPNIVIDDPQQIHFLKLVERGYIRTWSQGRYSVWTHR